MCGCMEGWMGGWVGRWVDGWTDGRTDGWMDGLHEQEQVLYSTHPFSGSVPRIS